MANRNNAIPNPLNAPEQVLQNPANAPELLHNPPLQLAPDMLIQFQELIRQNAVLFERLRIAENQRDPPSYSDPTRILPSYDGSSVCQEFITEFENSRRLKRISSQWVLSNISHFFSGAAQVWLQSEKRNLAVQLSVALPDYDQIWADTRARCVEFFDTTNRIRTYKAKNKALKFQAGDDPVNYVAEKLSLLRSINNAMTNEDLVENLMGGLTSEYYLHLTGRGIDNPQTFLRVCRCSQCSQFT